MGKNYYLGLDMGTSSVGWAVTDEKYRILRAKGKDLWGVRLFSEAKTAAERRTHRTSRRRLDREKARIACLKEMFAEEINKIDPGFYQRLNDSKYFLEDKKEHQPYAIFADTGYTDKEYYDEYPTIFHLRKALLNIENDKKKYDVRLVYLAILNMFKHRGHFLNANLDDKSGGNLKEYIEMLHQSMVNILNINLKNVEIEKIEKILKSTQYSNSERLENLLELYELSKNKNKIETEIFKFICGLKGTISKIYVEDKFEDEFAKMTLSFRDSNFDEKIIEIEDNLDDDKYDMFLLIKQIHDWSVLANIMNGEEYLSVARVKLYDKHKKDLEVLKKYYKQNSMEEYNKMFRQMNDGNYSAYVGSVIYKDNSVRRGCKSKKEDFYKNILNTIKSWEDCEAKEYITSEIDKGNFLPKQITASNGVIPNQVHKKELKKILKNASEYLNFLNEKDESGYTISEKIVKLFEFQIPYYVGPIAYNIGNDESKHRHNMWSVRKEKGPIYPWNFEQKIDIKKSSEKFIRNLINHCTYLNDEEVLPKNSLLYEKFMVLNELNKLKINGEKISVELKQNIFNDLFKKGKKVTKKGLIKYLKEQGEIDNCEEVEISGIDGDFTNKLSNYKKFADIFGVQSLTYEQTDIAENIIRYSTIYGDSRKFLEERIREEYSNVLDEKQIKRILGMKFKDWGRLSKELLELSGVDKETGEIASVISRMWNDNYNLMELIATERFSYAYEIEQRSKKLEKTISTIEYEDLDELYMSTPVKRMVWQTILVLKELEEVLGCPPKRIFVEMARDVNAPKDRKDSRKKKLLELYKNCKKEEGDWSKELNAREESEFKSKKLYLYYMQKGRCMYSGKPIDLKNLLNDNLYDIDHIYPRHFVKDDSIENNLVLVEKNFNAHKSDNYPIENEIRQKMHSMWKMLRDGNFITEEKYSRLIRKEEFTDDEKAKFISRQIVETRQGTKVITDLFEQTFPESDIVYVKAGNVSEFRHKFKLIKCRNVNDFHHANDAYLNIVVGNVYYTKFTKSALNFIKDYKKNPEKNKYHMDHMFQYPVSRGGVDAWITKGAESISMVRKMMAKNTPMVTRMNYEEHGGIADQTIYSAKEAEKVKEVGYIPIKSSDEILSTTSKYGGMKKFTGTYFMLIEHTKKNKRVRSLETMPLYLKNQLKTTEQIENYFTKQYGYAEPKVRLSKIKMYSLIKVDGFYLYLTGRAGKQLLVMNAVQLSLKPDIVEYIRKITKCNEEYSNLSQYKEDDDLSSENNIELYDILTEKHKNQIYSKRPNAVGEKLLEWREKFKNLTLDRQIYVLLQILQLSQLTNQGADLSDIGGSKKTGTAKIGKNIYERKECKLINQSVTGLYENEIDLLTV